VRQGDCGGGEVVMGVAKARGTKETS